MSTTTTLKDADPAEVRRNPFAGKTADVPRPSKDDAEYRFSRDDRLRQAQAQWDQADQWRKEREAWSAQARKDHEAGEKARGDALEAKRRQRRDAQRTATMDMLRRRFLGVAGTTEAEWERVKDEVFLDYARQQALSGDPGEADAARLAHSRLYRDL
jgi:hypothetical protein